MFVHVIKCVSLYVTRLLFRSIGYIHVSSWKYETVNNSLWIEKWQCIINSAVEGDGFLCGSNLKTTEGSKYIKYPLRIKRISNWSTIVQPVRNFIFGREYTFSGS